MTSTVEFSFRDPRSLNPYNIKSILGLDADLIIPKFEGSDGLLKFYNLILKKRTIVVQIGLNPNFADNETYSDLRDYLYKFIASSRKGRVELKFKNEDDIVASISGFVSKFETDLFERNQEVQLTIECPDPLLKAPMPVDASVAIIDANTISIGDALSNAPHGFTAVLNIAEDVFVIDIKDPDANWLFRIRPPGGFLAGDQIFLCSEFNNKSLYMIRDSAIIHLADVIQLVSIWPLIFPGVNVFKVNHPGITWTSISYYPTYWGV